MTTLGLHEVTFESIFRHIHSLEPTASFRYDLVFSVATFSDFVAASDSARALPSSLQFRTRLFMIHGMTDYVGIVAFISSLLKYASATV